MMSNPIILVTGANQGYGHAILEVAGQRLPNATYILSCRKIEDAPEAVQKLKDAGVSAAIEAQQLDITDDDSITAAVKAIEEKHGKLDVLINNAGIVALPDTSSLSAIRAGYNSMFNTNTTSVAVVTAAFTPLLLKSSAPKVINISSGLGSIGLTGQRKMAQIPTYASSKSALNALTVQLQVLNDGRMAKEEGGAATSIKYFSIAPGMMKTRFNNYLKFGKDPKEGAEVVVRLLEDDTGDKYPGGTYWEFEQGEMKQVPW
ncbi:short chain dehydrogenase/reductase family protein [Ophiobolus disseminans]|uniref:Short chain dehydrogenase/reductase family protein n=1 Tax=Ophiobolus disseminans TaxID=1469910 RepID=A0A6A7AJ69_9PLEO|nr:short chain dehydrogenase/reductase family protein [Ophiobolus disseminans]